MERGRACTVPSNVPAQSCALRTMGQFIPRFFYTVSILLRCICPDHVSKAGINYQVGRMQVKFQKVIPSSSFSQLVTKLALPFCATKRLDKQSGTLLPNATRERPITVSGIMNVYPIMVTIQTRMYEVTPIHTIQITKEK